MTIGEVHFTCFEHVGALFYHLWHPFIIASDCSWTMNITSSLNYPHCSIFGIDVKFSLLFIIVDEMYKNVIIVNIFISNFVTKRLPLAELHYFSIRFIKGSICTSNDANKPPPKNICMSVICMLQFLILQVSHNLPYFTGAVLFT